MTYCVHGTYIGTPCGADHMCGFCEDGVGVEEYYERHMALLDHMAREREEAFDHIVAVVQESWRGWPNVTFGHVAEVLAADAENPFYKPARRAYGCA